MRLAAFAALLFLGAASPPPVFLREQAWTLPGEDAAHDLTHAPRECLARSSPAVEIGRALFRSPAFLGGPAARLGLSCNACHTNGRANAHFFLPELTDRPGAADVTSEWASHVRGDGVMNPVDIPDLAGVSSRATHGQVRDASLEHFVRSVIIEEFQGTPPTEQGFAGLIAYLRALDPSSCKPGPAAVTLASAANDVRRALSAAESADAATASMLVLAAQDSVARIAERLPRRSFARQRRLLESLSRELGAMRAGDVPTALETSLPGWLARFDAIVEQTERHHARTYFDEAALRSAIQ